MITYKTEKKTRKKKPEQFAKFYIICQVVPVFNSNSKRTSLHNYNMALPATKVFCATIIRLKIHLLLNEVAVRHSGVRHSRFAKKKNRKEKDTAWVICVDSVRGKTQSQFNTLPKFQEETLSIQIKYLSVIHYK